MLYDVFNVLGVQPQLKLHCPWHQAPALPGEGDSMCNCPFPGEVPHGQWDGPRDMVYLPGVTVAGSRSLEK